MKDNNISEYNSCPRELVLPVAILSFSLPFVVIYTFISDFIKGIHYDIYTLVLFSFFCLILWLNSIFQFRELKNYYEKIIINNVENYLKFVNEKTENIVNYQDIDVVIVDYQLLRSRLWRQIKVKTKDLKMYKISIYCTQVEKFVSEIKNKLDIEEKGSVCNYRLTK